jgi:hypothetical protein
MWGSVYRLQTIVIWGFIGIGYQDYSLQWIWCQVILLYLFYQNMKVAGSTKELAPIYLTTESSFYLTHLIGPFLLAHLPLQP